MSFPIDDRYSFHLPGTNGRGVLLIHGLTGIPSEMKFVARALNRRGYSVYAPLLPGHGMGREGLIATKWQDWLDGTLEAAGRFGRTVDGVYAAGICVGGKLGMMAARRMPQVIRATAIYSACFKYDGRKAPFRYRFAPALAVALKLRHWQRKSYPETPELGIKDERMRRFMQSAEAEGVVDEFPAQSVLEMYRLGRAMKRELRDMRVPALILHAREDDLSSPRNSNLIARDIGAPRELHLLEDSYHMIHVDRQHRKVSDLTADFFEKHRHVGRA